MSSAEPTTLLAHGAGMRPPLTWSSALTQWDISLVLAIGLLAAAALYLVGVVRLRRRGDRWPIGRSLAFATGLLLLAGATMSWIGAYDGTLFWVHAVQHMVLSMIAPVFLALSAPVTLALRVLPGRARRQLLRVLHSLPVRVLASPLVSLPLFVGTLMALYFSSWYEATLRNNLLHELQHVHFVLTGCLLFWPLFGIDPVPGKTPHLARLVVLILTLPAHIIVGLSMMMSTELIAGDYYQSVGRTWGPSLFQDQYTAGGIIWSTGDLVGILYVAVLCVQWVRSDERDARRFDRHDDRLQAAGQESRSELASYNRYLRRLNGEDTAPGTTAPSDASDGATTRRETEVSR